MPTMSFTSGFQRGVGSCTGAFKTRGLPACLVHEEAVRGAKPCGVIDVCLPDLFMPVEYVWLSHIAVEEGDCCIAVPAIRRIAP